jgi:hypothetical protein
MCDLATQYIRNYKSLAAGLCFFIHGVSVYVSVHKYKLLLMLCREIVVIEH